MTRALIAAAIAAAAIGCARPRPDIAQPPHKSPSPQPATETTTTPPPSPPPGPVALFPFVRVDLAQKFVEFDAEVPIDAHDPITPIVYLELVACTPDTREHESIVVTRALPAHVHAAMLLIGLAPGEPGRWRLENGLFVADTPTGPRLDLEIEFKSLSGEPIRARPEDMIVAIHDGKTLASRGGHWVFAGSRVAERAGREHYDADGAGTLIGLATFGSEVIAWSRVISPEAAVHEPEWIADPARTPTIGTRAVVRIRPANPAEPPR